MRNYIVTRRTDGTLKAFLVDTNNDEALLVDDGALDAVWHVRAKSEELAEAAVRRVLGPGAKK